MRVWQVEEGLPQNTVTSVVQTRDGYLWIGTYSGLTRFDGVRFVVFDDKNTPEFHDRRITSLFESSDGTLWIGHENGQVTTYKTGKFRAVNTRAASSRSKIHSISTDEAGDVWLLNESGLLTRLRDGQTLSPQAGNSKFLNLAHSTNGIIWVARDGCLSVLVHDQLRIIPLGEPITNSYVQGVCPSRDGGLWVSSNGRIRKWKDGQWIQDLGAAPWDMMPLGSLIETSGGTLVAATPNTGIFLLFPGTGKPPLHFTQFGGIEADRILSLTEDREGNLWIGTGGAGLIEMRQSNIQVVTPPDNWRGHPVLSVCSGQKGELWIGTEGAGLYRLKNSQWTNFSFTNFAGNSYVWSAVEDSRGQLWVGTWGAGLFQRHDDHFEKAPGLERITVPMPALLASPDGGLWIGTSAGLAYYLSGETNWFAGTAGESMRDVRTIAEDGKGSVWFGTDGNGLGCLENGHIRQFRQTDGLSSDYIECLHFDADGALWIGTFSGGLCRLKQGHFSVIDREQGLPNSAIGDIEDDGNGFFWMSSHGGIIRASKAELNDCADGKIKEIRCLTYGINDGLPTIECSQGFQPAGCKTPDGRLWFPTSKGLVVVNPKEVMINHLPPPMAMEELLVDGERFTNSTLPIKIPPGHNRFEFHYTGLSFISPEKVSFKYRMEGLENNWVDAGAKRVANYNFIPPGNYTFHVIACNKDGVWNETGVSLPFALSPHFWQTLWFRLLGVLTTVTFACSLVWFDTRRRMSRRLEKVERQQAIERERARIAKDIHDDLGASLTRITMLSQSVRDETPIPGYVSSNLKRIHGTARELTRSMDEIVWAVNPRHDTLDSLASYLSQFAHDFLSAANIQCRLEMPLQLPAWSLTAEVRHNLFLAFKETLHNIVSHAAASQVRVILKLESNKIVLIMTDNGSGFDVGDPHSKLAKKPDRFLQGEGLANIYKRLKEIKGECEIKSSPGQGTTVKFTVPV
jgi:ligand-binding sensor domain-containing protein/signal transduction histidine kinase